MDPHQQIQGRLCPLMTMLNIKAYYTYQRELLRLKSGEGRAVIIPSKCLIIRLKMHQIYFQPQTPLREQMTLPKTPL